MPARGRKVKRCCSCGGCAFPPSPAVVAARRRPAPQQPLAPFLGEAQQQREGQQPEPDFGRQRRGAEQAVAGGGIGEGGEQAELERDAGDQQRIVAQRQGEAGPARVTVRLTLNSSPISASDNLVPGARRRSTIASRRRSRIVCALSSPSRTRARSATLKGRFIEVSFFVASRNRTTRCTARDDILNTMTQFLCTQKGFGLCTKFLQRRKNRNETSG